MATNSLPSYNSERSRSENAGPRRRLVPISERRRRENSSLPALALVAKTTAPAQEAAKTAPVSSQKPSAEWNASQKALSIYPVRSEDPTPYIVGDWVAKTIPCIIREASKRSQKIVSINYPNGEKTRSFVYEHGSLVRVNTTLKTGQSFIAYFLDSSAGSWKMAHDGVAVNMAGAVLLSSSGVVHIELDKNGGCRQEHPDGTVREVKDCDHATLSCHAATEPSHSRDNAKHESTPQSFGSSINSKEVRQDQVKVSAQSLINSGNSEQIFDLLSSIGHDLRSPLTSVQGLLTLLSAGAFGDLTDKAKERISAVEADLGRLIRLTNELFDAEKIVCGKMVMRLKTVLVQELLEATVSSLSGLALQRGIKLHVAKTSLQVYCDKDRMIRVLVNLVANAIKYPPVNSTVRISAAFDGQNIVLKVKDTGAGVPAEKREAIFERFEQAGRDDSTNGGAGLGLAISKAIVEAHGGTIGVDSTVGHGSTFWVSIPAWG